VWLSAPVSLTRFQVSKHPPVFLKSDSVTTVLRFPRSGPPEAAFPDVISTIRALRLPASNTGSLMYSFPRSHFSSPSFAPTRRRLPRRPGPALSRGTLGYLKLVDHRCSQVPGEPIPHLCPALGPRPVQADLAVPISLMLSPPLGR